MNADLNATVEAVIRLVPVGRGRLPALWQRNNRDKAEAAIAALRESTATALAAQRVARVAVGVCNDWMGDPDHGFVLDPLAEPVTAYQAVLYPDTGG